MKNKVFALFAAAVLLVNAAGPALADVKAKKQKAQTNGLVSMLPESDGVLTLDAKRFFSTALPSILAGNQPMLSQILAKVDDIQTKTGIDLRQFEQVAVGVRSSKVSATQVDFEPVVIARGTFQPATLVAAAKLASKGTYREENIGGKTVYVFSAKDLAKKNAPQPNNSIIRGTIDRTIDKLAEEVAVTALNANTLAVGSTAMVRKTLEAKTRVSADLVNMLSRKPESVASFAARTPGGLGKFVPLDNDEIGKNIDAIRMISGSLDMANGSAFVNIAAKTMTPAQAQGLQETIDGLMFLGKAAFGGSARKDQQVYARLIDAAKVTRSGNEVMLDVSVPQSDIDILIGAVR